jgi:hypothetical protein
MRCHSEAWFRAGCPEGRGNSVLVIIFDGRFWPETRPGVRPVGLIWPIATGIQSVAKSQPEGGKVMVRPAHYEALRQGKPELAYEYRGGNNQLELPVKIMRVDYNNSQAVTKVSGAESRI